MRSTTITQAEQLARLKSSLRDYKRRCASLERKVARLESASPCQAHEIEIARLERICEDIAARWEEAESEVLALRKQMQIRSIA